MQTRLADLRKSQGEKKVNLARGREASHAEGITEAQEILECLHEGNKFNYTQEEKNKAVEQAKEAHVHLAKVLDQAPKDIGLKNDEIGKLPLGGSALYRKCRLEDFKVPPAQRQFEARSNGSNT